jgi:glycerol-3-phosphate dehydrogenase
MDLGDEHPWLPAGLLLRYARAYGTRTRRMLDGAKDVADLGRRVGGDVHEVELAYARDQEFARTGEDFLWRRSKRGLHLGPEERAAVERWFEGAEMTAAVGASHER